MGAGITDSCNIVDTYSIQKKTGMTYNKSFRQCIQKNDNELLIFGADNFSQFPKRDASVSSKCDRALSIACKDDLVVLRTSLDHEYQDWLHSHGLGSDHVVEYKARSGEMRLRKFLGRNFSGHLNLQQ